MKIPNSIVSNNSLLDVLTYEPPKIDVVKISVEKGFADSTEDWGNEDW